MQKAFSRICSNHALFAISSMSVLNGELQHQREYNIGHTFCKC